MIYARELSGRSYPQSRRAPGVHHGVSHHRDDPELMALKSRIDTHNAAPCSRRSSRNSRPRPTATARCSTNASFFTAAGIGNGNLHRHSDIPCLTFGSPRRAGSKTGRHIAYEMDTPMSNFLVTMLQNVGVEIDRFGDSTGPLDLSELTFSAGDSNGQARITEEHGRLPRLGAAQRSRPSAAQSNDADAELFPGFRTERVTTSGAEINCVIGGDGPPLLLLHGAPQSHASWFACAPELS